ncbi:hypothetical protein Tco_0040809 [Tanacetum coccineum]
MEKIVEDLDILLSRMDIFVSKIKDTASDMAELMNVVGVVPENILQVKDKFKRKCMTIATNASNYKIDSLQIRALVKENSGKTDIPSCSSDEKMMDLISEKGETIELIIVDDKDNNMETFRKPFQGFSREGIRIRRAIGLRIILTAMETTLKRDFRTYKGESHFSPIMIAPVKKSPSGAIMYLQQRMKRIERGLIKSSLDTQKRFCVQRNHAR